jgi:glyoxylase-like metal-dependent hydrolase (beta-lactamase superfamily II)
MDIRFLNGGHCRQLLALIDRRSWRWVKFHAVFLAVRHPLHGWVLIDTGYGERFAAATRGWPYRLYRWATPVTMAGTTSEALRRAGIDPGEIRHVIITHFHADHIGGLAEFPHAQVHHHADAWRTLAALKPFRQLHCGYLPALVPDWLGTRSHAIDDAAFHVSAELPFPLHDLFGDGSITLVSLPGHAPGHLGILLRCADAPLLYATDAYWDSAQIEDSIDLIAPVLRLQWDGRAYAKTIRKLRELARVGRHRLLACHTPETQRFVAPAPSRQ